MSGSPAGVSEHQTSDAGADRWLEMELSWFHPGHWDRQAVELMERVRPLLADVRGKRGLVVSFSLRVHLLACWSGNENQPLPVDEASRYAHWAGVTYADLRGLLQQIRAAATSVGLPDLQIGLALMGGGAAKGGFGGNGHLYESSQVDWFERHSEVFLWEAGTGPHDPLRSLHADERPYAFCPQGIPEGLNYAEFLGGQWGLLSRFLALDAVVLRDYFLGPMLYTRCGPRGPGIATPEDMDYWTEGVTRTFRSFKEANPSCWVIGYSSAASPIGEWLVGCCDLERVVADGAMDAFISQTWAGAWQDFWSDTTLGWTFQLSNMLAHQAQIAGGNATRSTPCCLYHVVDTWDSFEPWDTLHTVPQKLAWGVWAFSHAALRSPNRLTLPQGAYLSWIGNRFSEIWSAQDVEFLSHHLDAAQEDARELEEVFGPEMVLDREAVLASLISHPGQNLAAFTDDQIGLLNKWGFGCLTAARADQICSSQPEGRVWQIPPEDAKLVTQESPVILAGRADAITAEGLRRSGVEHLGRPLAPEYEFLIRANDQHLHEPIFSPDRFQLGIGDGRVLVETQSTPLLVEGADGKTFYWQPQDWFQHGAIIRQSHLGSFRAYQTLSNRFHHARTASAAWICEEVPLESPVTVHIWRSAGSVKVLVGNLETGIIGDSRLPRKVTISLNMERLGISGYPDFVLESLQNANILAPEPSSEIHTLRFVIEVGPQGFDLFRLVPERSITQRGT